MKRVAMRTVSAAQKRMRPSDEASAVQLDVRPSEVPEYLRESEFFKSLNTEDDEEFHIPGTFMKANTCMESLQDASDLLHTIRYWGVDISLLPLVQFVLEQPTLDVKTALAAFKVDIPFVSSTLHVISGDRSLKKRMEKAMEVGEVSLVQYLEKEGARFSVHALALAATAGPEDCLRHALRIGAKLPNPDDPYIQVYEGAVANGHLGCVELLNQSQFSIVVL